MYCCLHCLFCLQFDDEYPDRCLRELGGGVDVLVALGRMACLCQFGVESRMLPALNYRRAAMGLSAVGCHTPLLPRTR